MHRFRLTLLALIASVAFAHAGIENAGTTAGNFLSVGTGAAILSMGGAAIGTSGDLNAAAWNPAALTGVGVTQFSFSHASLANESSQEWIGAGGRFGRGTHWAVSALYQGDGSFDGRDAFGASTGSFNVSSMALGLRASRALLPGVTAGLGAQWLTDNLGDVSGHGMAFDAGVHAQAGPFGFGAVARNIGGHMTYPDMAFALPSVYGVGASWSLPASGLRLAVDADFPHAYYDEVRVGGEWRWQDRIALRAGYRLEMSAPTGEPLGGPTFGLGAGANGMWMDYAFLVNGAEAQGQHRVGLSFHPGFLQGLGHVADGTPAAPQPEAAPVAAVRPAPAPAAPAVRASAPAPVADEAPVQVDFRAALAGADRAPETWPRTEPTAAIEVRDVTPLRVPRLANPRIEAAKPVAAPVVAPVAVAAPAPVAPPAPKPVPAPSAVRVAAAAPQVEVVSRTPDPAPAREAAPAARPASVVVGANESLAVIARRWHTSKAAIMMENNLVREEIKPGQRLRLPPAEN